MKEVFGLILNDQTGLLVSYITRVSTWCLGVTNMSTASHLQSLQIQSSLSASSHLQDSLPIHGPHSGYKRDSFYMCRCVTWPLLYSVCCVKCSLPADACQTSDTCTGCQFVTSGITFSSECLKCDSPMNVLMVSLTCPGYKVPVFAVSEVDHLSLHVMCQRAHDR